MVSEREGEGVKRERIGREGGDRENNYKLELCYVTSILNCMGYVTQ